jgi:hypothetical protein
MGILPQERARRLYKELPEVWSPKMCFVPPSKETHPESEAQFGDQAWWIDWFPLALQRLFCPQDLILVRVL